MRVWDVHPGYLDRGGLLGQHVEIHGIWSVLERGGGYSNHPEVMRWRDYPGRLKVAHYLTAEEMGLRGFGHRSPLDFDEDEVEPGYPEYLLSPGEQLELIGEKLERRASVGRIPLPVRASQFWSHHKYSVMARGYQHYKAISGLLADGDDRRVSEASDVPDAVLSMMRSFPSDKALRNTLDHLWGYHKNHASEEERKRYFESRDRGGIGSALHFIYELSTLYSVDYLLWSTIFADLPPRRANGCSQR